jgi:hypothetical protein
MTSTLVSVFCSLWFRPLLSIMKRIQQTLLNFEAVALLKGFAGMILSSFDSYSTRAHELHMDFEILTCCFVRIRRTLHYLEYDISFRKD